MLRGPHNPLVQVTLIHQLVSNSKCTYGVEYKHFILQHCLVLLLRQIEALSNMLHLRKQLDVLDPFVHATALADHLKRVFIPSLPDGLDAVFLVQEKVLQLLLLYVLLFATLFDFLVLYLVLILFVAQQSVPLPFLSMEFVEHVAISLLHLEFELADIVLFYLDLISHYVKGLLRVFVETGTVYEHLFLALLSFALRVGKLGLYID